MKNIIYIQIYKGENQYVAEGLNLPIVTQGKDLDEVAANVQEAVALHLDGEDLGKYDLTPHPQVVLNFELPNTVYA